MPHQVNPSTGTIHGEAAHVSAVATASTLAIATTTPAVITVSFEYGHPHASAAVIDAAQAEADPRRLLCDLATFTRRHPAWLFAEVYAYGIVLPERGVAYLLDSGDVATVIPLGTATDDPTHREQCLRGLAALLDAGPRRHTTTTA